MSVLPRNVVLVAYPGVQSLDLAGPMEVFQGASDLLVGGARSETPYAITVVAADGPQLTTSSGLCLTADTDLEGAPKAIDTLIVAGGTGRLQAEQDESLITWIARAAAGARRAVSVCTGAFLLARAGILDGRRATTHWAYAAELAARYPAIDVDAQPIFVRDGSVWTSAGVTAGMDLALALVEEDTDRDVALTIARRLVLFLRRPGDQAQFSATLALQQPVREPLREAQIFATENPHAELTIEAMAARAHMSPRNFSRAFRAETGVTPALRRAGAVGGCSPSSRGDPRAGRRHRTRLWVWDCRDHAAKLRAGTRRLAGRIPRALSNRPCGQGGLRRKEEMQIAILLFEGLTALDAVGPYEALSRIPDAQTVFVAEQAGPKRTGDGVLALTADATLDEVSAPDVLLIPGGGGRERLMQDGPIHEWLRAAHETSTWTTSVCTGSLVLASAGLLAGRQATTHWASLERLRSLGAEPVTQRTVFDGKLVTAAGVSAGIDMALELIARECGPDVAQEIQLSIEYDPEPPFDAGSPAKAPAQVLEAVAARYAARRGSHA